MSQNFLIEHDRHGKIPTRITVYEDWQIAEERLFRLDMEQLDELNLPQGWQAGADGVCGDFGAIGGNAEADTRTLFLGRVRSAASGGNQLRRQSV